MAYTYPATVDFGPLYSGLTGTIGYRLYNSDGTANGSRVTSGITELGTGTGIYNVQLSLSETWRGSILWDTGGGSPIYAVERIGEQQASGLLFESVVVSYETSELATALYIAGGPNQSGCFNRATVVVYDASNNNAPCFQQIVISEPYEGNTYLNISSAFSFTPEAGDMVRIVLNPREIALIPIYDPAKTAAQPGDEMALTVSARTTLVAELEAEIADDATGEAVKQAIIAKLIENLPELDDLSLAAIAEACATAILATPAYKLVTDASGAVVTDSASRTASKNTASEIRTAVGLATANLDTQLGAKATSDELAAVQSHGDSTWATATEVGLFDIDGVNWEIVLAAILANAVGASEVTDSVVEYKRRDGLTTVATVTMGNTAGTRTTSVLVGE